MYFVGAAEDAGAMSVVQPFPESWDKIEAIVQILRGDENVRIQKVHLSNPYLVPQLGEGLVFLGA